MPHAFTRHPQAGGLSAALAGLALFALPPSPCDATVLGVDPPPHLPPGTALSLESIEGTGSVFKVELRVVD